MNAKEASELSKKNELSVDDILAKVKEAALKGNYSVLLYDYLNTENKKKLIKLGYGVSEDYGVVNGIDAIKIEW